MSRTTQAIRVGLALLLANLRYWRYVAPQVRQELRRWSRRAEMILDSDLRELALEKLQAEHFNAEVAATLATLVPAAQRRRTVEAIVAFEVLYDFLDGLTERTIVGDPLTGRGRLFQPFTSVFDDRRTRAWTDGEYDSARDGGYRDELSATVHQAIATLPATPIVRRAGTRAAERCAAGQIHVHAAQQLGVGQLEQWAQDAAIDPALGWAEYIAGAVASVLAVHALIVVAADDAATEEQADAVDATYLAISAMSTMLDSLVDYERDVVAGDPWLVRLYGGDLQLLGDRLVYIAEASASRAQALPHHAHHLMTLMGVVAYYTSAPEAQSETARPVVRRIHRALRPSILPTLVVMRAWRLAKRARRRFRSATVKVPR